MKPLSLSVLLLIAGSVMAAPYADRFVWVFGWGLNRDTDVAEITRVIERGAQHGVNGAVVSFGLDTLCRKPPEYFRRLDELKAVCDRNRVELIPAIFSVGYGGGALNHDRNLAEGLPVENAPFVVRGSEARLVPDPAVRLANGGFEEFTGHRFRGFNFHDQPGEISFVDTDVTHGGKASIRLENFTANPQGHGRVMLNMDEIRMGGTCRACRGRNMGELLGECITRQVQAIRRHLPGAQVYIWSDMLDPNHNARPNYYLVEGDYTGSWRHVPKDLIATVWGGAPREKSLQFLANEGFATLIGCYYDAEDLRDVTRWLELAQRTPKVRGLMYTPWRKKYDLLPEFGDLLQQAR